MALILTIDTAMERGSIGLFDGMRSLGSLINDSQKDHAGFVQSAIGQVMQSADHDFDDLDAIAVVNGPGSYTGLRVGLSTAKGLCYAMDKRLITLNTLELMAFASIAHFSSEYYFYIPMIDARREDVFMGVYDHKLNLIAPQQPLTLSIDFFEPFANEKKLAINGSGIDKASLLLQELEPLQWAESYAVEDINTMAQKSFSQSNFTDIAYSEPDYLKAFYTTAKIHP